MTAAITVLVLSLACLAVVWVLYRQEPAQSVRMASLAGAAFGFVTAFSVALLTSEAMLDAVAIGIMGAVVLPLVLLAQLRFIRVLTGRR